MKVLKIIEWAFSHHAPGVVQFAAIACAGFFVVAWATAGLGCFAAGYPVAALIIAFGPPLATIWIGYNVAHKEGEE